jgi:cytochrome b561
MLVMSDTNTRFGFVSVALHWYVAVAMLFLLTTGFLIFLIGAHGALRPLRADITYFHMSVATTSIPIFLLRIFWRVAHGMPQTHDLHGVLKFAADTVWRLLLLLLVWQMIWGVLLEELHWFELAFFRIPQPLLFEDQAVYLENLHRWDGFTIGTLLVLHVGGAMKHYLINRDQVLQTMLRPATTDEPQT